MYIFLAAPSGVIDNFNLFVTPDPTGVKLSTAPPRVYANLVSTDYQMDSHSCGT